MNLLNSMSDTLSQVVPDLEELQSRKLIKDASPIRLPIPKCYLGKYVPFAFSDTPPSTPDKINESIIVMEDLKKQGYCNVNFENGLTLDQVKSAFESVSRLHALSLAMKVNPRRSATSHRFPQLQSLFILNY